MQDPYITEGDAITDKMKVYLDVFGALMLNRIARKVGRADVVTINDGGSLWWTLEFMEELA